MNLCKHCRHSSFVNRPAITDQRRMILYCYLHRKWAEPACDQWEREPGIDDDRDDITEPRAQA